MWVDNVVGKFSAAASRGGRQTRCPICNSIVTVVPLLESIPVSSAHLYAVPTAGEEASFTAGACSQCGHIHNTTPCISDLYDSGNYVVKKSISSVMSTNLSDIISFIDRFASESTNVLEIGSGSGETAKHFALNGSKVVTVDPCITGYDFAGIEHHTCFFDGAFVSKQTGKFDLIIARHILEHTFNPIEFLVNCRKLIANQGWIYIELPNVDHSLMQLRALDFFNDHIQHFSENSLSLCGMIAGFKTFERKDILGGAHIGLLMQPAVGHDTVVAKLNESTIRLACIIAALDDVDSFVLYGAGAHAATFVAAIGDINRTKIVGVFDKDTNKIGKFLPGISAPVSYPERVDATLIVNTSVLYSSEIHQFLINELGFCGQILDI